MNFRNFWASIDKINFILILILGLLGVLLSYSVNQNFLIINRHSIFYIFSLFIIIFYHNNQTKMLEGLLYLVLLF